MSVQKKKPQPGELWYAVFGARTFQNNGQRKTDYLVLILGEHKFKRHLGGTASYDFIFMEDFSELSKTVHRFDWSWEHNLRPLED